MGKMSRISLAMIFCLIDLASIFHVVHAQDSPQDYLNAHNTARAAVRVGPLRWDDRVASFARNYAEKLRANCKLVHSGGTYEENLAWGRPDISGTAAVNMWVEEKRYYDYNSNRCVGGVCGHYTQVVWSNSVRLGCAKVRCNNGGGSIITCNYDPPGNYVDQHPYLAFGDSASVQVE